MALEINGLNTNQTNTKRTRNSQQTSSEKNSTAAEKSPGKGNTTVSISAQAHSLNQIQGEVSKGSAIDEAKVASIKAAIDDGSYQVDAQKTADNMLKMDDLF